MIENDEFIMFPEKTMFRAMVQQFGLIKMRKSEEDVKKAKFIEKIIPLVNDHDVTQIIGYAENFTYHADKKSWTGDILFEKKYLSDSQLKQIRSLAKRELSIEYEYTLKKNSEDEFKKTRIIGDQTELLIHNIAWVNSGRCESVCGLDTKNLLRAIDSNENAKLFSHEVYKLPDKDCDHKELKSQIVEKDSEIKKLTEYAAKMKTTVDAYLNKERDSIVEQLTKKTGKDAKHYKEKSLELLKELYEEVKDVKKDGFPDGEQVEQDDKKFNELDFLGGTNDISQLLEEPKEDKKYKLVEVQ